ncbi:MAG TPA: luciferase family protein [Gaiellaceae bacterium]|nr:luciferase family protein [Gaiellaceae bacterium]
MPSALHPELPRRQGPRPRTTATNPHMQLDQQPASRALRDELAGRLFALPDVRERPSLVSVPGARALWLDESVPAGPREAFLVGREFAHLHPFPDESLHVMLPPELAERVVEAGWGEPHPAARLGLVPSSALMLYAPRDEDELELVATLVEAAYGFAREAAR